MRLILKKWQKSGSEEIRYYINTDVSYNLMILQDFYLDSNLEIKIANKNLDLEASSFKYRYEQFFKTNNLEIPEKIGDAIKAIAQSAINQDQYVTSKQKDYEKNI